ncbi:hypothetical protein SAMN05421821_102547 [Mucilaginibacter lappiensis]|uniref:Uncharacterized protein n=1 Tax=Mucilaginibacter lappiensis TaxID=354630 RepID=A0ABR6PEU2_9SPHI|nr:hypothetical protein [Mucilaginibacter lappiensis]SIQ47110.1 hypothetical protein SAMN05421821_102547 [Mucilaginibacter lappiensis]
MLTIKSVNHVNPLFVNGVNPTQYYTSLKYLNRSKKKRPIMIYDTASFFLKSFEKIGYQLARSPFVFDAICRAL